MRLFKIAAFSLLGCGACLFFSWAYSTMQAPPLPYEELLQQINMQSPHANSLTQVKEQVNKSYWFFHKREKTVVHLSYPISQVFQGPGLIEEMFDLEAEACSPSSQSLLTSQKGRFEYGENLLIVEEAHLERFDHKKRVYDAFASSIRFALKNEPLTFVATDLKAEIS